MSSFSLTCNNYNDDDVKRFRDVANKKGVKTGTLAYEIGKEKTPHLQCALSFSNKKSLDVMRKLFPGYHIEPMQRTIIHLHSYCCKGVEAPDHKKWKWTCLGREAEVETFGAWPCQGARSDLMAVCNDIKEGASTPYDILTTQPTMYHQYGRTINELYDRCCLGNLKRTFKTKCIYLCGSSGSGKTRWIYDHYDFDSIYVHNWGDRGWWDSYSPAQHHVVVFDDFRSSDVKYNELLKLLDRYPYSVPRRGQRPLPFMAKTIIITSVIRPEDLYKNHCKGSDNIKQLMRRLHEVIDFDEWFWEFRWLDTTIFS